MRLSLRWEPCIQLRLILPTSVAAPMLVVCLQMRATLAIAFEAQLREARYSDFEDLLDAIENTALLLVGKSGELINKVRTSRFTQHEII